MFRRVLLRVLYFSVIQLLLDQWLPVFHVLATSLYSAIDIVLEREREGESFAHRNESNSNSSGQCK